MRPGIGPPRARRLFFFLLLTSLTSWSAPCGEEKTRFALNGRETRGPSQAPWPKHCLSLDAGPQIRVFGKLKLTKLCADRGLPRDRFFMSVQGGVNPACAAVK